MKPVLVQATKAINQRILASRCSADQERFSKYPVLETEFWGKVFEFAKNRETAGEVLMQMSEMGNEPCAENDRVMRCIDTATKIAQRTLASLH